jgi:hypothetical protein
MAKPKRFARNAEVELPVLNLVLAEVLGRRGRAGSGQRADRNRDGDDKTRADQGFHGSASLQNTCATVGKLPA